MGEQELILTDKATTTLNGSYLQIVGHESLYVDKQTLPKFIDTRFSNDVYRKKCNNQMVKAEDDNSSIHKDSDGENR